MIPADPENYRCDLCGHTLPAGFDTTWQHRRDRPAPYGGPPLRVPCPGTFKRVRIEALR